MANEQILRKIRFNYSKDKQDISWKPTPDLQTNLASNNILEKNQSKETNATPKTNKLSEIALGFFGWEIFSNAGIFILFLTIVSSTGKLIGIITIGVAIVIIISLITALLIQKKSWVLVGITIALIINFGFWLIFLGPMFYYTGNFSDIIYFIFLPFPGGFIMFMC